MTLFWVFGTLGAVLVMPVAWTWFGWAFSEERTDECRALAAGTSMGGYGALLGLVPLIVVYAIGAVVLWSTAAAGKRTRSSAVGHVLVVMIAGTAIGIAVAQFLLAGQLFVGGAAAASCLI
ncbi:hypothetical protein LQ938_15155 [Microbacterium sp. cx-55]|uniref:hypothetical protein n=1 Tax=unclassified Microbacterium TaxID=2609290 RepID=UPI001CBC073D|nr:MULTISPECIES: hypothetical protein [unclassified Microbacterium]MBZ4487138.1 hypothetical protein [Microbacterium sp. cx-55]MCC4908736.1 hypothetical protein [Microbacterium sp. cx-59]UGB35172.1 hypothetical protein LQ938_15155 [Microbacterium sp. cx-55]